MLSRRPSVDATRLDQERTSDIAGLPGSKSQLSVDLALGLFILAVLANVALCAAYPVDIFAQMSSFRSLWLGVRWVVLVVGILFAAAITRFMAMGMFASAT